MLTAACSLCLLSAVASLRLGGTGVARNSPGAAAGAVPDGRPGAGGSERCTDDHAETLVGLPTEASARHEAPEGVEHAQSIEQLDDFTPYSQGVHVCNPRVGLQRSDDQYIKRSFAQYPLTTEMYHRAEFFGNWAGLRTFLKGLAGGSRPRRVHIVGGSFTLGRFLGNDSWPQQLRMTLQAWGPAELVNWAIRGTDTEAWLHHEEVWKEWRSAPPDLIVLELAVNDQVYGSLRPMSELPGVFTAMVERLLSLPGLPPLLFVEAFRTAGRSAADLRRHCPPGRPETLAQHLLDPETGSETPYGWCSAWWQVASVHQEVLRTYRLPYFSYRDLVWPVYREPPRDLPKYWNGLSHPDGVAHHLLARGLAHMLDKVNREFCRPGVEPAPPPPPSKTLHTAGTCTGEVLTSFNADRGPAGFPRGSGAGRWQSLRSSGGVWKFGEDVPGKPGWIAEANSTLGPYSAPGLTISFDVEVGTGRTVVMEYLQSYHAMGRIAVWLDDDEASNRTMDAFTTFCYSIRAVTVLPADTGVHKLHVMLLPQEAPHSDSPFDIVPGNKFKLLGLTSC